MPQQPVRVLSSPLTGRIYALTSYTVVDDGANVVAIAKHDVTGDVRALITKAMQTEEIITCLCDEAQLSHGRSCVCGAAMRVEFLASHT